MKLPPPNLDVMRLLEGRTQWQAAHSLGIIEAYATLAVEEATKELRAENERLRAEARHTLSELRTRLHSAGRRPEECYEMSLIDDTLAALGDKHG